MLTWENSDPTAVGYNVYCGGVKLNEAILNKDTIVDHLYAGNSLIRYEVRALNSSGEGSPPRVAEVFPLGIDIYTNQDQQGESRALITHYFNQLTVSLHNLDPSHKFDVDNINFDIALSGQSQFQHVFTVDASIDPLSELSRDLVIPMGVSVEDHLVQLVLGQYLEDGSQVTYRNDTVVSNIIYSGNMIELTTNDLPLAGGISTVHQCIRNHGYAAFDVIVNRNNGADPGDIYVAILNEDGLEISRGEYTGYPSGSRIDGKTTYVTIPSGESLCVDVLVRVPESPEKGAKIRFVGVVDSFTKDLPNEGKSSLVGLEGDMKSGITLSEYLGTAQVEKATYVDDETVVVRGSALECVDGQIKPSTSLKIGFYTCGFKCFEFFSGL